MVWFNWRIFFEWQPKFIIYLQIMYVNSDIAKVTISATSENNNNLNIQDHHLKKIHQIFCLNKPSSREICWVLILANNNHATSEVFFEKLFNGTDLEWRNIYILPRIVTADIRLQILQHKLTNSVLYLNKMLFKFGKISLSLCSFCKANNETPVHLFSESTRTNHLFNELQSFCSNKLSNLSENSLLLNHLLYIFKYYVYNAREDGNLSIELLETNIYKTKNFEKEIMKNNTKKSLKRNRKLSPLNYVLDCCIKWCKDYYACSDMLCCYI